MNSRVLWTDQVPSREGTKNAINDMAISPDGTKLVVAVGTRVLLYNFKTGDLLESLNAHKDIVTTVSFSFDNSRFASGGADSMVILWKATGQGILKYPHSTAIQRVAFNHSSLTLLSCSDADFGIWSPDQSNVTKEKVTSKILSCSWAYVGNFFAIGLESGTVSIRKGNGPELHRIEKKAPVWCLQFLPSSGTSVKPPDAANAVLDHELIVGCWDKTISCYKVQTGSCTIVADKRLKFYPCALSISGVKATQSKLTSLLVSGSNGKASIYSKDCIFLADVQERKGWTFANACHGDTDRVAVGNEAGFIDILQLSFNVVHALYKDRYVYRENLTEVVIQHLLIDRKIRIKCKELVEKVALYKNHLVVKLTNKVTIYESSPDDPTDLHFRSRKEKIPYSITCDLMATVSQGVFFCNKSLVEYFTFDGTRQRVWQLGCNVSYVRVDGGAAGCEAIIIGLSNGNLIKLYAVNPFPVQLFKIDHPIVACDLDCRRNTIALIDTNSKLTITDLKSQKVLFSVENATSVSFNTDMDGSLAYSTDERIFIISGVNGNPIDPDKHVEVLPYHAGGSVLGYYGNRIFCLVKGGIYGTDVSQSVSLQRAIESNDLKSAYKIACLGATDRDLRLLAVKSLRIGDLSVAKKCYSKLKDIKFLNLVESIERSSNTKQPPNFGFHSSDTGASGKERRNRGSASTQHTVAGVGASKSLPTATLELSWQAEVLAYEGHFNEAAKMYARAENIDEAIRLLVDLRRWDDARMFAQNAGRSGDQLDLTLGQASWLQEIGDWKASSELFSSMGRYMQAAKVIVESAESGWQTKVIELVRSIPSDQKEVLSYCGEELCSANEDLLAKEALQKLGDLSRLMQLYVKKCMWSDAAKLADEFEGDFDRSIFLPYAEWLISQDQFEEAMAAYRKAARQDLAKKVLEELTFNAVIQRQYKDASYYYFLLSKESANGSISDTDRQSYELKADLYYAYSYIHSCIADSFTNQQPEALFQISRFVLNGLGNSAEIPLGISKFSSFYTLAKQAMKLGCYKLARHCFDRLGRLLSPVGVKQEEIEKDMLILQAKPLRDNPDYIPVCYRCGASNPLLNPFTSKFVKADVCTNCGHPFIRSFINFEVLPLVEFVPSRDISDDDAIDLIRQHPSDAEASLKSKKPSSGGGSKIDDDDVLIIDDENRVDMGEYRQTTDLFTNSINRALSQQGTSGVYIPVIADAACLAKLERTEIFIRRLSNKKILFYRNMLPEIAIATSQPCGKFFHLEDFEFSYLSNSSCPYSRAKNLTDYGNI